MKLAPAGLSIALLAADCGGMGEISTPDVVTFPQVVPNTTASTNLNAIVSLERAAGRPGRLIAVSGFVNDRGQLVAGGPWYYTFREPGDVAGAVHQWRVDAQGGVTYEHLGMCGLNFSDDLAAGVGLDSDRIIALALQQGGQDFLAKYQGSPTFGLVYGGGQAQIYFTTTTCVRPSLGLNRNTGAVTDTSNFACSEIFIRPCGGPGAF